MAVFTTASKTWAAAVLASADLNAQVRDFINGFGAWTSYTPTLSVFTPGNGTATGAYLQVQKLVIFRAQFTFGTTSTAATGVPTLSLPVTAKTASIGQQFGGWFENTGVAKYGALVYAASTGTISLAISGTSDLSTTLTTTTPFTWATGSNIYAYGTYEAA